MKGLFIAFMSILLIFFIARLGVSIVYHASKGVYYKSFAVEILDYFAVFMTMVMAIMIALSLQIMGIYTIKEVEFSAFFLAAVGGLYMIERGYKVYVSKDLIWIRSAIIDLSALAKTEKFKGVLSHSGKEFSVKKEEFEEFEALIESEEHNRAKLEINKILLKKVLVLSAPIILSIIILIVGLVLAV